MSESNSESIRLLKSQIENKTRVPWSSSWKRNQTKAQVLNKVREARVTTVSDLCLFLPHMTEGQIRGVLHRAVNARRPYVERKLDAESPNAYRYFFRVTLRGSVWIEWAKKVGWIGIEPEPDLDDEDDDEEEMAWLGGE